MELPRIALNKPMQTMFWLKELFDPQMGFNVGDDRIRGLIAYMG
jgi:hypothetical protein